MDRQTQEIILEAIKDDEKLKRFARAVAKEALLVQLDYLKNGSPTEKQNAARAFMPLFTKLLTDIDDGNSVDKAKAEVREMISSMLTPKKKTSNE